MSVPRIRHLFFLMLTLFFGLTWAGSGHAFTVELDGEKAQKTLQTLQLSPYKAYGTGKKVVYVIGSPVCGRTQEFFEATQALKPFFDFRWILRAPKDDKNLESRFFGFYEAKDGSILEEIFLQGHKTPVKNAAAAAPYAALARVTVDVVIRDLEQSTLALPLLIMPTDKGLLAMDYSEGMAQVRTLKNLIAAAQPEKKSSRVNIDALMEEIASGAPAPEKYCAQYDLQFRLLPNNASRSIGVLKKGSCLEGRIKTKGGWTGLQYYDDTDKFGNVYIKSSQLNQLLPAKEAASN